ncbi:carboxypeptidase-like regulatory domain-containing protein [Bifidobacterium adolescentis]
MQRINWFPDPLITGKLSAEINNGAAKAVVVADNKNWLRVTSTATGDNFGQFSLSDGLIPPAGTYHVHARVYAQKAAANFIVYSNGNSSWKQLLNKPVADGQTLTVDSEITIPEGCQHLLVRMQLGREVGLIGMMSEILIESADTYDKAVGGGASGLLHRRHHATRLTPRTGTVVPDDGHEPMHEPILDHHPESRQVGEYHDRPEQDRDEILDQCLCERHRRHDLDNRSGWRHQRKPTYRIHDDLQQSQSCVNELFRQVRQSDRYSDRYAPLHVCRLSGEQDPARQHQIFQRGYDAARLIPMGVVA